MKRLIIRCILLALGIFAFSPLHGFCEPAKAKTTATIDALHPGITSGFLTFAKLADLPKGLILRSGKLEITEKELEDIISRAPVELQKQLGKNRIFLLEQISTEKILLQQAKDALVKSPSGKTLTKDADIIQHFLKNIVDNVKVRDEETKDFFTKNEGLFGGASFEQLKDSIKTVMLQQKQQEAVTLFVKNLGKTVPVLIDASWTKTQIATAIDNPVDKARLSEKPSLIFFGSKGCGPCDMMEPIREDIKIKYAGKLNVLFISVNEEKILASRYGIQAIPVQVFFNNGGKEVFRHTGFFPYDSIEKTLSEKVWDNT